jgi:hypothetical protein
MILGWAQTQPSGRVVTHLHWVPGYRRRHTAAARLALATVVATVVVGYYEATYYVATTNQATMRLLPGYYQATTRLIPVRIRCLSVTSGVSVTVCRVPLGPL